MPTDEASAAGHIGSDRLLSGFGTARALAVSIFLVSLSTTVLLVWEGRGPTSRVTREIQNTLGGLGLGATVVPVWSHRGFDPRLDPVCESEDYPIPEAPCFAPDHGGTVFDLPSLRELEGLPHLVPRARGKTARGVPQESGRP